MTPSPSRPDDDLVDALLDRLLELPADRLPAELERVVTEHPAHADAVRSRLRTLESLGLLAGGGADAPMASSVPERLGAFRLLERLGGGGMGVVYRARQDGLKRDVALKVLRPELMFFEQSRARFRREAMAVARLAHPGIVPVHTVGEAAGVAYLTMELVDGCSLEDALAALRARGEGALRADDLAAAAGCASTRFGDGWNEAVGRIAAEIADALAHAHERGVVHRDVKPSNVMIARDGRIRLLDFGLAVADGHSRITRTGTQLGSLQYSAPEQIQGGTVDGRSDVFSLGAVLWELLTLRPAFEGASAQELTHRILSRDPEPARRSNPDASPDLEAIACKALEKDPARRFATAAAMAADLSAFLDHRPVTARRVEGWTRVMRWARREPLKATLVAVLAAGIPLLTGLAGYTVANLDDIETGRAAQRRALVDARLGAGFLALANDATDAARKEFEAALALAPDEVEAQAGLDAVRARLDPTLRTPVDPQELAAADGPIDAARLFALAVRLRENGRRGDGTALERALDLLERAVDRAPAARALYLQELARQAGWCLDADAADRAADALQTLWPDEPLAWEASGSALMEIDPARAIHCFERAIELQPDLAHVHGNLGIALRTAGRLEDAITAFARAVELDPRSSKARIDLGSALHLAGRPDAARAELEQAVALDPGLPGARYNLGVLLAEVGDVPAAIAAFDATVRLAPDYAEAWNNLGWLRLQSGDVEGATAALTTLTRLNPGWIHGWKRLALAHWSAERWDDAIAALERAASIDGTDEEVREQLATLRAHEKGR